MWAKNKVKETCKCVFEVKMSLLSWWFQSVKAMLLIIKCNTARLICVAAIVSKMCRS